MTAPEPSALDEQRVRETVQRWHDALARKAPLGELHTFFANGLLVELPDHVLRGSSEFDAWYRDRDATALSRPPTGEDVTVRVVSPKHAEISLHGSSDGLWRSMWIVLQDGVPRIRSITVRIDRTARLTAV
ncbi:hypothetical protein [Streptomyces sp. NPDC003697]